MKAAGPSEAALDMRALCSAVIVSLSLVGLVWVAAGGKSEALKAEVSPDAVFSTRISRVAVKVKVSVATSVWDEVESRSRVVVEAR